MRVSRFFSPMTIFSLNGETDLETYHLLLSNTNAWEIDGETAETVSDFIFGAPKSLQMVIAAMKLKDAYSLEGKL